MNSSTVLTRARLIGARSQETYDALLRALSYPGRVHDLPEWFRSEQPFPAPLLLPLALADVDVPVWIDDPEWASLVADATGAPLTERGTAWALAVTDAESFASTADAISTGTALEPEAGARVAVAASSFETGIELEVEGPGINGSLTARVAGLPAADLARLGRSTGEFPKGFDTWLFTREQVMALPRTTAVAVTDQGAN